MTRTAALTSHSGPARCRQDGLQKSEEALRIGYRLL
jgi:hypothetical protein